MTVTQSSGLRTQDSSRLLRAGETVLEAALESGRRTMDGGTTIDEHQVHAERLAYGATELRAAREMIAYAGRIREAGPPDPLAEEQALAYTAEVVHRLRSQVEGAFDEFGVDEALLEREAGSREVRGLIREGMAEARLRAIGRQVIEMRGANQAPLGDEELELVRRSVRDFAKAEVAPIAERIHRTDELVPDELIGKMAEQGFFAASIPERYGGAGMGYPAMIITTEELSAASLGAAGSLATRPEILAKALLAGGTERQKQTWLPRIASGEFMVGIGVTEPDVGSDVASVSTRAEPAEVDGRTGWVLNGAKAWSTFSGRANVLAEERQPHGGMLSGTAIPTPGYRGMHSFMVSFDNFFVPAENLVGEEGGLNRGFYLQMGGFAAGRLQTGGRATGVSQAALEKTATYVTDRRQFGKAIGEYQLTQYKLGRMATHIAAGRQLTYAAARVMDADENASIEGAMCKLLASDIAVWVTQEGQLIHGGWGYAEETAISRYVVDAQVLPIFEGVKPILELSVIARGLLGA
jgi:(2S)-methylsuccinyl-CoA dehydrogenase